MLALPDSPGVGVAVPDAVGAAPAPLVVPLPAPPVVVPVPLPTVPEPVPDPPAPIPGVPVPVVPPVVPPEPLPVVPPEPPDVPPLPPEPAEPPLPEDCATTRESLRLSPVCAKVARDIEKAAMATLVSNIVRMLESSMRVPPHVADQRQVLGVVPFIAGARPGS